MATIVNTPSGQTETGSGVGFFMGMLLLLLAVIFLFYYGLPAIRNVGGPTFSVPERVDVNVNNPQQ